MLRGFFCLNFLKLSRHERQKAHEARALDGERELPLIAGSEASLAPMKEAAGRIQKFLKNIGILIVYVLYIV